MTAPVQIGSYRIERLLGIGSFATVWLGYDGSLDARVAIKVLAENWSHDLRVRERFLDEARMLWRLDHERIVRVHSLGELPDGRPYLVMAWADRGSLRDRLAEASTPASRLRLLREICAGVAVLHDNGIVHRDLTPGNVLFRSLPDGDSERVVIADLGLAKALASASGLTARAGTPGYMAPEQDDPLAIIDRRADVYGLGRLGVRLLATGVNRRPNQPIRLLDGVPPIIADVLRRATAHRAADRYADASALGAALSRAIMKSSRVRSSAARARRRMVGLLPALAATIGFLATDSIGARLFTLPGVSADETGRLAIGLPDGWRGNAGTWAGPSETGPPDPALMISPDPERWAADKSMPGAFVWLSRDEATPAAFLAGRSHAGCVALPVRTSRQAGIDWVIAGYRDCDTGRASIVEIAGAAPRQRGLVYVQVAPPANSAPTFVDTLLAGVRIRET